jgi:hypothetical protein
MTRSFSTSRLAVALGVAALAGAALAPAATAIPYQDLRSPDKRDAATGYSPTTASQPAADTSPASDGFDWTSAAIGAAVGAGLLLVLVAAFTGTGKLGRRSIPARGQSTASA